MEAFDINDMVMEQDAVLCKALDGYSNTTGHDKLMANAIRRKLSPDATGKYPLWKKLLGVFMTPVTCVIATYHSIRIYMHSAMAEYDQLKGFFPKLGHVIDATCGMVAVLVFCIYRTLYDIFMMPWELVKAVYDGLFNRG